MNQDIYHIKRATDNEATSGAMLSARNSEVAEITANLIIKNTDTIRQSRYG